MDEYFEKGWGVHVTEECIFQVFSDFVEFKEVFRRYMGEEAFYYRRFIVDGRVRNHEGDVQSGELRPEMGEP